MLTGRGRLYRPNPSASDDLSADQNEVGLICSGGIDSKDVSVPARGGIATRDQTAASTLDPATCCPVPSRIRLPHPQGRLRADWRRRATSKAPASACPDLPTRCQARLLRCARDRDRTTHQRGFETVVRAIHTATRASPGGGSRRNNRFVDRGRRDAGAEHIDPGGRSAVWRGLARYHNVIHPVSGLRSHWYASLRTPGRSVGGTCCGCLAVGRMRWRSAILRRVRGGHVDDLHGRNGPYRAGDNRSSFQ